MQQPPTAPSKRPSGRSNESGSEAESPSFSEGSPDGGEVPLRRKRPSWWSNGSREDSDVASSLHRPRSGTPQSGMGRVGSKDSVLKMWAAPSMASWVGESEGVEGKRASVFMDAEAMKDQVRQNLFKEQYDVSMFYKLDGIWPKIAQHPTFEKATLAIIALNAIWIGIDTDGNGADVLLQADPEYQIAEHFFCVFFSFEWFARFMSFEHKLNGLRDSWFVFDSLLVFMMVGETWIFTIGLLAAGLPGAGGIGNASILRMARLARLTRMARMARLLRAMPELMILIKGIVAATRSVLFTLLLLIMLLYIFGIAFTQLMIDTEVGEEMFGTVPASMFSLLVCGTLQDGIGDPLAELGKVHFFYGGLYLLFVLLATVTVMNMLIGVLCEVVSNVASVERESLAVSFVRSKLASILESMDEDGSGTISESEFMNVMDSKELVTALHEVGVDVEGLTEFAPVIFADEETGESRELSFPLFMARILELRGNNLCTVKDMIQFHKFVKERMQTVFDELKDLKTLWPTLTALLSNPDTKQIILRPTGSKVGATHQLFVTLHSDPTGQPQRPNKGLLKQKKRKANAQQEPKKTSSEGKPTSIEIRIPDIGATLDSDSDAGSTTGGNAKEEHSRSEDGLGILPSHGSSGYPRTSEVASPGLRLREDWSPSRGLSSPLPPLPPPTSSAPSRCDSTPAQLNSTLRLLGGTASLAASWHSAAGPVGKDGHFATSWQSAAPTVPGFEETSRLAPETPPMTRLAWHGRSSLGIGSEDKSVGGGGGGGEGPSRGNQLLDPGLGDWSCSPQMSVQVSVDTRLGALDELKAVLKSASPIEMPRAG